MANNLRTVVFTACNHRLRNYIDVKLSILFPRFCCLTPRATKNFSGKYTTGSPECAQVLYSAQWDSVLVLKRRPTERYIKPVRIPGYL